MSAPGIAPAKTAPEPGKEAWRGAASLIRALAAGEGAHLLGAAGVPVVVAACAAAWAAALGGTPAVGGSPVALPGASALLAAGAVMAAALCVAWERAGVAAARYAEGWRTLTDRGASRLQVAALLVLTGLPLGVLGGGGGLGAGILARAAAWSLLGVPLAGHAPALLAGIAAGVGAATCAAVAVAAAVLGRPRHHRQAEARWVGHLPLDAAALLGGGYLGLRTLALARAAALTAAGGGGTAPAGAFGTGSPTPPPAFPEWWAAAGGALLLWGAALAAGRLLSWGVAAVLRILGSRMAPAPLLAARATARSGHPLRLVLMPALACAAAAYTLAGAAGAVATGAYLRTAQVGADAQVDLSWPPCGLCGQLPPLQDMGAGIAGAAAVAPVVSTFGAVSTGTGEDGVTVIGVTPGFGAAAVWPRGEGGTAAEAALAASPSAVVLSTALATHLGLAVGDHVALAGVGYETVAAIVPLWPVAGPPGASWIALSWLQAARLVAGPLQRAGGGFTAAFLVRLARGGRPAAVAAGLVAQARVAWLEGILANPLAQGAITPTQIAAAVAAGREAAAIAGALPALKPAAVQALLQGLPTVASVATRALPPAAGRRVPLALAPLVAAALLLLVMGVATETEGAAGLPAGNPVAALGAAEETARARRGLRMLTAVAGAGAGVAAGVAAAALFWPSLLLVAPAGAVFVPFLPVLGPAWVGAALAAAAAVMAGAAALQRARPNPAVTARLAARPSPDIPALPRNPALGRLARALREAATAALRPGRAGTAIVALALRRITAARGRIAALAGGLLVAAMVAATVPLFAEGAMTRVLREADLQATPDRPAGAVLATYVPPQGAVRPSTLAALGAIAADSGRAAGLPATAPVPYLQSELLAASVPGTPAGSVVGFLTLDSLPGFAAHATWLQGRPPSAQPEPDGTIEVAATRETMRGLSSAGLYRVGQVYELRPPGGGSAIRIRITGVFAERHPGDAYWPYRYFEQDVFVAPALLQKLAFQRHEVTLQDASWYTVLDFGALAAAGVPGVVHGLQALGIRDVQVIPGAQIAVSPIRELQLFVSQEQSLVALLRLAALPILGLALYFVVITAGVVVDAEAAEISAHASRGASSGQMLGIYLAEWGLLALPLTAAAVPLGALLARVMGASVGFLRWGAGGLPLPVIWQARDFAYAGAATVLAVAAALVPVAAAARRSIVEARSRASRLPAAPLWQRAYLDVAALALVFVVRALLRGGAAFSGRGLAGPAAIYILPPVFLIAVGLLAVRALGHLLRWLDRRSGPRAAVPVSLALRRVGRLPAQFAPLLVLLCLTAALGAFSAASARTLQRNLAAEVEYVTGADLRLVEASPCTAGNAPLPPVCSALGPAYAANTLPPRALPPFALQMALPGVAAATDVQEVPVTVAAGQQSVQATLVLVDPATFATAAWWGPHLDPLPEASYLALLRTHPDGALLSPDLGGRLPVNAPLGVRVTGFAPGTLSRLGVIPRWPGADVAGPMLVASAAAAPRLAIACPILPTPPPHRPAPAPTHYCPGSRIALMRLLPGARPATMPTDLVPDGIAVSQADLASAQIVAAQRGPQWAGQSGMLSVAFLVALAVAAAGYLLYAWLLLHGQLPQLGLLRAVGIDEAVLVEAVAAEQAILVAAGALAGVLAGLAAAALFVPLYQPEFSGAGGPPFIAAGPGSALAALAGLLLGLLALAVGLLLMLLQRLHVGESVKLEL